jgi:hypothetical protein
MAITSSSDGRVGRAVAMAIAVVLVAAGCQASAGSATPDPTDGPTTAPTVEPTRTSASAGPAATSRPSPTTAGSLAVVPSPTTAGSPAAVVTAPPPAPSGPPAAPTGVTLDKGEGTDASGLVVQRFTVRWDAPLTPSVTIRVFGVTRCLNKPTSTGVPCVVDGMRVPAGARTLLAHGPSSAGVVSWTWPLADVDGPVLAWDGRRLYYAFVVTAANDVGRSPFVVAESAVACSDCMS